MKSCSRQMPHGHMQTAIPYLDKYTGSMVCSKQLYKEALNHAFDEPKQWEIRALTAGGTSRTQECFPNMADKRAGSVKTRQRTPATRLKKRWTVLWRSQNRWSFHSENDSPLHPLLLSRCRAGCRGKSRNYRLFSPMTTKTTEK